MTIIFLPFRPLSTILPHLLHHMTSTAVHTTSLTVPSTQNTAPILDFCCLYTHDLRRKAKRWQDGILRFHTFNKRVMVYDILRNFIGDTHWRERDPLQDGDDVELEKGVLVQVGESTGSTDQDLSELFKNRRNAQGVSPGKAVPVPASTARSIPVPPSQLRPRTLNSLLGTPRGPLGRAAIPSKSPYQTRREHEPYPTDEQRPTKRQRGETRTMGNTTRTGGESALPQEPTVLIQKAVEKSAGTARNQVNPITKDHMNSASLPSIKASKVSTSPKLPTSLKLSSSTKGENIPFGVIITDPKRQDNRRKFYIEPENQLQIIARKPRKKLMCTNLLPRKTLSARQTLKTTEPRTTAEESEQQKNDRPAKIPQAHHDRLKARLKEPSEKVQRQQHVTNDAETPYLIDSEDEDEPAQTDWLISKDPPQSHPQRPPNPPPNPPPKPQTKPKTKPPIPHPLTTSTHPSPLPVSPARLSVPPLSPILSRTGPLSRSISLPESSAQRRTRAFAHHEHPGVHPGSERHQGAANSSSRARPDQAPDPWSREAWDLFGYERPQKSAGE